MLKDLKTGLIAIVVMTVFLGLVYPLAITGISQVVFPGKAGGSLVKVDGKVVGSSLIGQDFKGEKAYFQSRPSATEYSGNVTFFGNAGPNSKEARDEVRANLQAYLKRERPYAPELRADGPKTGDRDAKSAHRPMVPVDAVTQSASGVDPQISEANARIQAHRIAAVRHLPLSQVEDLISANTDGRFLGLLGEPGVNVLELNIALDKEAPIR
ncbi:MAG TPA: K(+)-transporting ATPase subunit C [Solirubrobacterales bacterium]|jgi:K+-transporting ATPase ATPase C chain|nr:K(+)-transporting ATPase subunit C [Solirubrobacterales bacterium]